MERIQRQSGDLPRDALLIFSWVVKAKRQITVPEMRDALAVEIGKSALDKDNYPTIEHITRACAPLIVVDEESNIVRLVHYTTQEYFERTSGNWLKNAQIDITNICITYLSFSVFDGGHCPSEDQFYDRVKVNSLYSYAAKNWGHHAREALNIGMEALVMVNFLENEMKRDAWSEALMVDNVELDRRGSWIWYNIPRQMSALHLAAFFGLYDVVVILLEKGHNPNTEDTKKTTPLSWACRNGHTQTVMVLLRENANPETKEITRDQTPLSWAAINGHERVVKLLLEKDVDLESKDRIKFTPLLWAARNEHAAVVDLLLARNVNQDAKDRLGRTPLAWSVRNGNEVITKLLLDNKADVNVRNNNGTTALHWAAWEGHEAIMSMLLQCGPNVETINADGGTALTTAIEKGHHKLVHLLLENGASFNYRYPLYKKRAFGQLEEDAEHSIRHVRYAKFPITRQVSPLWRAAEKNDDTIMKLLLDRDAEMGFQMNLDDHDYRQDRTLLPLMWATKHGYQNVVRLLLDAKDESGDSIMSFAAKLGHAAMVSYLLTLDKIDADEKDEEGRTPLSYAAQNYCTEVVTILLASGKVDADEKDEKGSTPLSYAARRNHTEVVTILLASGKVDADEKDEEGRTPLSYAAQNYCTEVVTILLASGKVDADEKDEEGRTPLSYAAQNYCTEVVTILLASGKVDATSNDHHGRTPLSHAAGGQFRSYKFFNSEEAPTVELFIAADNLNIDSKDDIGRTPLSYAAEGGRISAMRLLVDSGKVDVNSQDKSGRTPLSYLAFSDKGKLAVTHLLAFSGFNIEAKDNIGRTPISHAACNDHADTVELLLEFGADRDSKDDSGQTPLLRVRELRRKDPRWCGDEGYRDNEKIIRLLELPHADLPVKPLDDLTALTGFSERG